jgi:DNA polymerase
VNALPVSSAESARRREDVLRELNLYPLWQLRMPVSLNPENIVDVGRASARHATENLFHPLDVGLKPDLRPNEAPQADIVTLNWTELKNRVKACTACTLRAGCTQAVFGMGDEKADWLFVGSWPTEDDDLQGEPFAGQAGQLLDNMLAAIKLKRGINVYFANVVKCAGSIKRGPQAEQIAQCSPYLDRQIQLLQPKLIMALGHAAATALLGEDREWNSLLGKVHTYRGLEKNYPHPLIPLIITHHPAALLLSPQNKAQTWRDLCLARDTMNLACDAIRENK